MVKGNRRAMCVMYSEIRSKTAKKICKITKSKFFNVNKYPESLHYIVVRKKSAVRNVSVPLELSIYIRSIAFPSMGHSSFQLEKLKFSK